MPFMQLVINLQIKEDFRSLLLLLLLLLLSCFSRVRLCVTWETVAHQAPPSLGFSRQEYWSGLLFPSPMHESEKWKWSPSVVLLATPWTAAYQAPPSMGFARQEDRNGLAIHLRIISDKTKQLYSRDKIDNGWAHIGEQENWGQNLVVLHPSNQSESEEKQRREIHSQWQCRRKT